MRLSQHLSFIEQDLSWKNIFQYVRQTEEDQVNKTLFLKQHFDEHELKMLRNPALDIGERESKELVDLLRAKI
ncbi:hypothetical protein EDD58_10417 [Hazenella coriacea]|uniref:Uncharacterized protein n=1 Tax=Hazenella coriacea TaxID=1179467 RepID=A0A4R3L394_9BACL|nr:hypothetical protein EDD58_10417 [Hazenella coriacea]